MKLSILLTSGLAAVASAIAIGDRPANRKSYSGYKVFRVDVENEAVAERLNKVIDTLGLSTWKARPRAGYTADIVVPPTALLQFESEVADLKTMTMHEDLEKSIEEESAFGIYAGM